MNVYRLMADALVVVRFVYVVFGLAVLAALILIPPRWPSFRARNEHAALRD